MFARVMRRGLEKVLRWRGYELKQIGMPPRGFAACLKYAKSRGLAPNTVYDVGVGRGTSWLYEAFPQAKLVLFEPLSTFAPDLDALVKRYGADVHSIALSNETGSAALNFNTRAPTSSSLLEIHPRYASIAAHADYEPKMVNLDRLDRFDSYPPPYVLKLDVEGAELKVLEGGRTVLQRTDFLITEISVMRRTQTEPTFAQIVGFLDGAGFALFDLPSLTQNTGNEQLIYLDAAFVKKDSHLWP